jgi:N-sulfoglucosamine sulfohydrolase
VTMYYPMRMVRSRQYKYVLNLAHPLEYPFASDLWGSEMWQGVLKRGDAMMGSRAVKSFLHRPKEELYDVAADPNELKNLLDDPNWREVRENRNMHEALKAYLEKWREQTNDPWLVKGKHE